MGAILGRGAHTSTIRVRVRVRASGSRGFRQLSASCPPAVRQLSASCPPIVPQEPPSASPTSVGRKESHKHIITYNTSENGFKWGVGLLLGQGVQGKQRGARAGGPTYNHTYI